MKFNLNQTFKKILKMEQKTIPDTSEIIHIHTSPNKRQSTKDCSQNENKMAELAIIKELLFLFQGIDSEHLNYSKISHHESKQASNVKHYSFIIVICPLMKMVLTISQLNLVKEMNELGFLFKSISQSLETARSNPSLSLVFQVSYFN